MKHTRKNKARRERFGPYGRACGTRNRDCSYCSKNRTHKHERAAAAAGEPSEDEILLELAEEEQEMVEEWLAELARREEEIQRDLDKWYDSICPDPRCDGLANHEGPCFKDGYPLRHWEEVGA